MELRLLIRWPGDKEINLDYLDRPDVITRVLRYEREAEEPGSEGCGKSLDSGKGKRNSLTYSQPWGPFDFSRVKPRSDFRLQNYQIINVCCFKSLCYLQLIQLLTDSRVSPNSHVTQQGQQKCVKGGSWNVGWILKIDEISVWRSRDKTLSTSFIHSYIHSWNIY